MQHDAAATSIQALEVRFTMYDEDLERLEVFKYLGHLLVFDNNDTHAIRSSLKRRDASGLGSLACFGPKIPLPMFVVCSIRQRYRRCYCLAVKHGTFHLRR